MAFVIDLVDHAHMRVHQRRKLAQQQAAHGGEVALALQHVGEAGEVGLQPVLLGIDVRGQTQVSDHRVDVVLELGDFAARINLDRTGQVALGHRGGHFGDRAHLRRQVRGEQVDVTGQVLPRTRGARHVGLAAQPAFDAHFARDTGDLVGEGRERLGHVVDGLGESGDFALRFHGKILLQIAVGDRGHDLDDAAHVFGEVGRHEVDGVGEVLPGAGDARNLRLAAELAFGADFARHARHFAGKRVQLIDHRVDGVFQLEDFALHVHGNLAGQVAARHGGGDFGDVADLGGEIAGHRVDVVGEVLPGAGGAGHVGLAAEPAFGADFAGHARHFAGEAVELVDHGVERFLQLKDFAAHVDRDFSRQVAAGDRGCDLGDVADLGGQIARHRVHAIGEVLPGAGDAGHLGLAAQLAVGADFARHARHFAGKRVELVHHRIERFLQLKDFTRHVHGDLLGQVALGDGGCHFGDVADLGGQVRRHRVDAVGEVLPGAGDAWHRRLPAELAFGPDFAGAR